MTAAIQRTLLGALVAAGLFAATPAFAAGSDLHISPDGTLAATNVLVYQVSGSALYCRAVWGSAFVRLTVIAAPGATILKNHGAAATVGDIRAGDLLTLEGSLAQNADSLYFNATKITDLSANQESKTLSGTIKSVGAGSFVLTAKTLGTVTVYTGTSTITKGARTITSAELVVGDKVLSASGSYSYTNSTFAATGLTIYQDPSVFYPRNFQGTVTAISGSTLPATLTVSTAGEDYLVYFAAGAKVLSKNFAPTQLSRVQVGDTVRWYGAIRQQNLANIDAEVLRDLNF